MAQKRSARKRAAGRPPGSSRADGSTRATVLAAARSVFARLGFEGATTREVALTAGVNNAMIYYHFRGKIGLYRAVLEDSFLEFDRLWEDDVFASDAPARSKLRTYINGFIRFQHRNEELRRILSMEFAACGENTRWLADRFFQHNYRRLASILREGMRKGELQRIDPSIAIMSLIGMLLHPFILRPIAEYVTKRRPNLSVSRFGGIISDVYFDGLGIPPDTIQKRTKKGPRA